MNHAFLAPSSFKVLNILLFVPLFLGVSSSEAFGWTPRCLKKMQNFSTVTDQLSTEEKMILTRLIDQRKDAVQHELSSEEVLALAHFGALYGATTSKRNYFYKMLRKLRVNRSFDGAIVADWQSMDVNETPLRPITLNRYVYSREQPGFVGRHKWTLVMMGGVLYFVAFPGHATVVSDAVDAGVQEVGKISYVRDALNGVERASNRTVEVLRDLVGSNDDGG